MRVNITLACTECGDRNYISKKNKRNNAERIELKKYCKRDKKSTLHRETKGAVGIFSYCFFFYSIPMLKVIHYQHRVKCHCKGENV